METLYEKGLAPLPKSEGEERLVRRYHEQFQWPLAAAIVLLLADIFLTERRSPTRHEPKTNPLRAMPEAGVPSATLVLLLLLAVCGNVSASPSSALREYNAGNYTNAMQEFERHLCNYPR